MFINNLKHHLITPHSLEHHLTPPAHHLRHQPPNNSSIPGFCRNHSGSGEMIPADDGCLSLKFNSRKRPKKK